MIEPKLAPVKPRVISPQTGEVIPLEDVIRELLDSGFRGQIWIVGPAGTGKTTALHHLAAVFFNCLSKIKLVDGPSCNLPKGDVVLAICTATTAGAGIHRAYRLAP